MPPRRFRGRAKWPPSIVARTGAGRSRATQATRRARSCTLIDVPLGASLSFGAAMTIRIDCGRLFTGLDDQVRENCSILVDGDAIADILPRGAAREVAAAERIDLGDCFVMPGLVDVHTHLAYGNAKSEEDIDLYGSLEFRAVRGLFFAQQ